MINIASQVSYAAGHRSRNIGLINIIILIAASLIYIFSFVVGRVVSLVVLTKSRSLTNEKKQSFISMTLVMMSALVGGMCYIIGSNTTTVLALSQDEKENDFNCDDTCLDVLSDASTVLLVIASILFSINEIHGGKLYLLFKSLSNTLFSDSSSDDGNEWLIWAKTAEIIAFSRVFDSAFATVAGLSTYEENCPIHEAAIIWSMYVFLLILWGILLGIIMIPGALQAHRRREKNGSLYVMSIAIVFISSACMLIGNNNQPLGCAFDCDIFSRNYTNICHQEGYHGVRITSLIVSCMIFGSLIIGLSIHIYKLKWLTIEYESTMNKRGEMLIEMDNNESISDV